MLTFRNVNLLSTLVAFNLFVVLLFAPQLIFSLFGLEGNPPAYFLSRRAAMLFLGLATLAFTSRNAAHSEARQSIMAAVGVTMAALAILGVAELARGYAGPGIFLAIGGELLLVILYLRIWLEHRHAR